MLDDALGHTGITDASGEPLRFRPHDFRRLFITDAVMNGMPPHIAQLVVGHNDINTTMGYKAVYPEEAINGHRAFIARRRALRPAEEYRTPPSRNGRSSSATSNAARSPSAPAAAPTPPPASTSTAACDAHCCGRTPPSAAASSRSATTSLTRIAEAHREGWLGEVDGLKVSLAGAARSSPNSTNSAARAADRPPRHARISDIAGRSSTIHNAMTERPPTCNAHYAPTPKACTAPKPPPNS